MAKIEGSKFYKHTNYSEYKDNPIFEQIKIEAAKELILKQLKLPEGWKEGVVFIPPAVSLFVNRVLGSNSATQLMQLAISRNLEFPPEKELDRLTLVQYRKNEAKYNDKY